MLSRWKTQRTKFSDATAPNYVGEGKENGDKGRAGTAKDIIRERARSGGRHTGTADININGVGELREKRRV